MLRRFLFLIAVLAIFFPGLPAQAGKDKQIVFGPVYCEIDGDGVHFSVHEIDMDLRGKGVIVITNNTPQMKIKDGFIRLDKKLKSHKKHKDYKKQKGSISLGKYLSGHKNKSFEKKIDFKDAKYLTVYLKGTPKASITVEIRGKGRASSQNEPPVADDQTISIDEDTVVAITLTATDADGDSLTYAVTAPPDHGTLSGTPPKLTYTPHENYNGSDSLSFKVNDGLTDSNPATVSLTIKPVNNAPSISGTPDTRVDEDTAYSFIPTAQDIDVGDSLTFSIVNQPAWAGFDTSNGELSGTPGDDDVGTTTAIVITVRDTSLASVSLPAFDLEVVAVYLPPIVSINTDPAIIPSGQSSTLTWSTTDAISVTIDQDIGAVGLKGSTPVSPTKTTTYTITAFGPAGTATDQVVVTVEADVEPQPEGSFGEQYDDLIPPDATTESYDPKRFSVITGLVHNLDGVPIANVSISILDHLEYGTVRTSAGGRFSIPVEGGGAIIVSYQKAGLITAHRQVYVPWNDIAIAETLQMIAEDPVSTTITFDGNPDRIATHQSTEVTDEFGRRSVSMIFTGDNMAYLVDEEGNDIHELTTINARATEFTTLESMPAILPPNSAYTYCVELSVDGSQRVRFDKPIITYINNFLDFDVGEIVPVGYYDRDKGVWVPSDNGVVVRLMDTDEDGIVDALDTSGDGLPDFFEVIGLDDAQRYPPDSTFWRVAVTHFTPWDCNWPYGPPSDSIAPNPQGLPSVDNQKEKNSDCNLPSNSFVEARSRIYHEDIPLPGTDLTLHYASNRVEGYQHLITVPASGETVPSSLKNIIVNLDIAGRTFSILLKPLPDQLSEFVWDGLDHLGRQVSGRVKSKIKIGFVYDAVYWQPGNFDRSFAQVGDQVTGIRARREIISWKTNTITLLSQKAAALNAIAEGWTLSSYHYISPSDPVTIYKGDGSIKANNSNIITTVAGNGSFKTNGDGGPATAAGISYPYGLAVDSAGNIYITDADHHRVRKIDTNGIITTVAGSTSYNSTWGSYSGDGGPATAATLFSPYGVAVDSAGNIFIADGQNYRIRKVDTSGIITTVAGNGLSGFSDGDGGPATSARLGKPFGVAVDDAGNFYIAVYARIRKVDTSGIITTVAGNGLRGFSGDGGPATSARLGSGTNGVAVDSAGNIYIATGGENRIRKVDTSGIITTVAGNGSSGFSGDGGPATEAAISYPDHVSLDNAGNIYIVQRYDNRIRKVDTNGIITTVAGNGVKGFSGDGGIATSASLNSPERVAVDSDGNIYIADFYNYRVRKVAHPATLIRSVSAGEILFIEDTGLGHIVDGSGYHKKSVEYETGITMFEYTHDLDRNLISITDRFGNQTTITRDLDGVPTSITSPDRITTVLTIDSNNHLTQITYPDDSYYGFEYTPDGLMTAEIEPEGNRFEHIFDALGRLTDIKDQEEGHWNHTKTAYQTGDIRTEILTGEQNLTTYLDHTYPSGVYTSTITDPTGAETTYSQSADGLMVDKFLPCGMQLEFKYDFDSEYRFKYAKEMTERTPPPGLVKITLRDKTYQDTDADDIPDLIKETVSVNGKITTLAHNTLLGQKVVTSPESRTVTTHYDRATLLTESVSPPGLFDTSYGYDTRGRLTSISTITRQTTFAYNAQGFLESVTDPEDYKTTYYYDAVGRMTAMHRPDTADVFFTYDNNGNMTVLTNPATIDHGFGFNKVNRNDSYLTPLSGSYQYLYDKDRRLIQTTFPSGDQINNIYDPARLTQIQTPEGNIDFAYLCGEKVESITNGTDTITYGYDGKLVTSETLAGTLSQSLGYTYNNDFNLTGFSYAGNTVNYTYDNDGLLTGAGNFTITRNTQNGLPGSVTSGMLSLNRGFNGYGEVSGEDYTINSQGLTTWSLTRDNNGRITNKTETVGGTTSDYIYIYDPMGRLLTVAKDSAVIEEYDYDANGTRIYEKNTLRGIAGRYFSYDDEDHLFSVGSDSYSYNVSYSYNLNGYLTAKTNGSDVTTYDYSYRGELLSVTLPDTTVIEYLHDPLGRRIAKKINGTTVEKYLWQGLTRLLADYDGSDNLLMRFEYADGRMPVAMTKGDDTYYLTYDQVGSLRAVANSAGNVIKSIEYDSFGNILSDSNPDFAMPFGFAGGLHDSDTGLVRFGYRDYDPDIGRWTAKDPIFFAGGDTDLYGYVLNNPINWIDPTGRFGGLPGAAIGAVTGGIGGAIAGGITGGAQGAQAGFVTGAATGAVTGLIGGPIIGGVIGTAAGALFGDMLIPSDLTNEDRIKQHYENMQEAERILQEAIELNRRLDELCGRTGGCYDDNPCN